MNVCLSVEGTLLRAGLNGNHKETRHVGDSPYFGTHPIGDHLCEQRLNEKAKGRGLQLLSRHMRVDVVVVHFFRWYPPFWGISRETKRKTKAVLGGPLERDTLTCRYTPHKGSVHSLGSLGFETVLGI